jgi:hypothetical protein
VGSDDGLVHITRDGGKAWSDVTPKDMPEWSKVSLIDASPHDAATAYLAIDRQRLDDFKPYIYKTSNYGKSWTKITEGLPSDRFVHAVREDPKRKGLLYAGTETGIFVSFDDGAHWQPLQLNLPATPVHDLTVKDDDLVIATHGRSFWILDDITPLRQFNPDVAGEAVHLYEPRVTYRPAGGGGFFRPRGAVGQNPPGGAILDYYLKSAPGEKDEITLEILDGKGKVIRKYSNKEKREGQEGGGLASEFPGFEPRGERLPVEAGLNRFSWDLRYEKPTEIAGAASWGGRPAGPLAVPGQYQVRLTVPGVKPLTVPLEIKLDPRLKTSQADLAKQFDLAMKIRDRVKDDHDAVKQIRDVRTQLKALETRLKNDSRGKELVAAAEQLDKKMTAIEEELIQVKSKSSEDPLNYPIKVNDKLMALEGTVESAEAAPTQQSYEVFDELSRQLDVPLAKWKDIQSSDLANLNQQLRKQDVQNIMLAPAEHP